MTITIKTNKTTTMNNFNIVLAAIRQCARVNVPSTECFERVKDKLDTQYHEHLDLYLDFLQDLGLIHYNVLNRNITLTERGRCTEQLFT